MESEYGDELSFEKYEIDCDFIRERRLELEYTQTYIAFCLGYRNASSYYKSENGDQALRAKDLPIIAQLLKCDINDLYKKIKKPCKRKV